MSWRNRFNQESLGVLGEKFVLTVKLQLTVFCRIKTNSIFVHNQIGYEIFGGSSLITKYSGHNSPFLELLNMATPSVFRLSEMLLVLAIKSFSPCFLYSFLSTMSVIMPSSALFLSFKV